MKIGDLIKVEKCSDIPNCECFFCYHKSSCVGLVTGKATDNPHPRWVVEFDCGEWELSNAEGKVISD